MLRSGSNPGGNKRPPRSRRPGRAGVGPGPAYRPSSSGGGTSHKGGKSSGGGMCRLGQAVGALILASIALAFTGVVIGALA